MPRLEVDKQGNKSWYDEEDHLHNEDGPAYENTDGTKFWYKHGKRHREGGPAFEFKTGTKLWYINNELHREDGPAVEYSDGNKYWYYHGALVNCSSQEEYLHLIKLKAFW